MRFTKTLALASLLSLTTPLYASDVQEDLKMVPRQKFKMQIRPDVTMADIQEKFDFYFTIHPAVTWATDQNGEPYPDHLQTYGRIALAKKFNFIKMWQPLLQQRS